MLNNHVLFVYADDSHSSGPAARPLSVRRLSRACMRFLTRAVFFLLRQVLVCKDFARLDRPQIIRDEGVMYPFTLVTVDKVTAAPVRTSCKRFALFAAVSKEA